jgi:hypothetical protein
VQRAAAGASGGARFCGVCVFVCICSSWAAGGLGLMLLLVLLLKVGVVMGAVAALRPATTTPSSSPPPATAAAAAGVRRRHFFFDRLEINESDSVGVDIKLHRPSEGPDFAMTYDEPWENQRSFGYNSVVDNGTHVLLYYLIFTAFPWPGGPRGKNRDETYKEQWYTCLATSADGGKTFVKPRLGVIEINGTTDNNCVWPPGGWNATHHETGTVFLDSNPGVPPSQRYKMVATNPGSASSPDGIHWKPDGDLWAGSDTQQVAWWDEQRRQYVGYRRQWWETKEAHAWRANNHFCVPTGESHGVEDGKPKCGKQELAGRQVGRCVTDTWGKWEGW